jgi:hypothetical protein
VVGLGFLGCAPTSAGGAQDAGTPVEAGGVRIAQIVAPVGLAVDTQYAFVTTLPYTALPGQLLRIPLDGGQPVTLATGNPGSVALDNESVYWTDSDNDGGWIRRIGKDGSSPAAITGGVSNDTGTLALDSANVYWAGGGAVWRVAKDGGAASQLARVPLENGALAVDDAYVYASVWDFALDGGVVRVGKNGGAPQQILDALIDTTILIADDAGVYAAGGRLPADASIPVGVVVRYDKASGASATLVSGNVLIFGLAVAGSHVFLAGWRPDQIDEVSVTGGGPRTLAGDLASPTAIALQQADVYWIDLGSTPETGDLRVLRGAAK